MSDSLKIVLVVLILVAMFVCPVFFDGKEEKNTPHDYFYEIGEIDYSLKSKYGLLPEDALSIIYCYLFEDEDDYYPVSEEELHNAYNVIYHYYYDTKDIAQRGMDDFRDD